MSVVLSLKDGTYVTPHGPVVRKEQALQFPTAADAKAYWMERVQIEQAGLPPLDPGAAGFFDPFGLRARRTDG